MGGLNANEKQSIIGNRIGSIYYIYGKYCRTKEELFDKVFSSLTLKEKEYFEEYEVKLYFKNQIDYIWEKLSNEKIDKKKEMENIINGIKAKYDENLEKLLLEHKQDLIKIRNKTKEEEEKKLLASQKKFQNMYNDFQKKIMEMEKNAENERKIMENKQKEIGKSFELKLIAIQKQFEDEKNEENKKKTGKKKEKIRR